MNSDSAESFLDRAELALRAPDRGRRESETSFLQQLLCDLGGSVFPSALTPARLFRAAVNDPSLMQSLKGLFRVVALPSKRPEDVLQAGDWMLRVVPGTGDVGHVSVIAFDDLLTPSMLTADGIPAESALPGYYGVVIEGGAFPHCRSEPFARRVLDCRGCVPPNTVVLRPIYSDSGVETNFPQVEPKVDGPVWAVDAESDLEGTEAFTGCPAGEDIEFGEQLIPQQAPTPQPPAGPDSPVANRFVAAHSSRYCTPGQAGSATCRTLVAPRPIRRVVIHTLAVPSTARRSGTEAVIAGWQNPGRVASAHYLVDRDGAITQMVREANVAFHTPGNNGDSIGIEHADVCNDPTPLTTRLYERSAALVRDLATRHAFAINNNTVAGHSLVNPNHGDPGPYWDWEYYFLLLAWDGVDSASRPIRLVTTAAARQVAPTGWQEQRRRAIANDHCANQRDSWGATYWRAQPSATGTAAELSMAIDEACTYKVSLWWPDVAGANPAVPVDIEVACLTSPCSGTSTQSVIVSQRPNAGRWNDVAVVSVTQTPAELKVRWRRDSAQRGWILVDGVRLLKIGSCPGPSLQTAPSDEDANAPFSTMDLGAESSSLGTIPDPSTRANWDIEKWVETEEELMEALAAEQKAALADFDGKDLEDVGITQPDGAVRSPNVDVFPKPDASLTKQASLPYGTTVPRIVTKKQAGTTWWYEIDYDVGTGTTRGWAVGEGIAELAWPGKFTFLSPGSGPFEELRDAVKGKPVEEKVARSINFLNVMLLPDDKATLGSFVFNAFYQALVAAKGNFKEACLILTASFRALKPDEGGTKYRWVQQVNRNSRSFNYADYADRLWHFFWNAYKRLDGTSAWKLDKLGIAYELKSRSSPIWSAITLKDLSRDAKEDIVFNRGGIAFAEWLNNNHPEVTKAQAAAIRDNFVAVGKQSAEFNKLSEDAKAKFIQQLMEEQNVQDELKKRSYTEFSNAAEGIVDNVVKWIKQVK